MLMGNVCHAVPSPTPAPSPFPHPLRPCTVPSDRVADTSMRGAEVAKEVDDKMAAMKAANPVFAALFNSSKPAVDPSAAKDNLFIRTTTSIYTHGRE